MFCAFSNLEIHQMSTNVILAFLEFLHFNKFSPTAILNIGSAVKTTLLMHGISIHPWHDKRIAYFIKSTQRSKPPTFKLPRLIDVPTLKKIVSLAASTHNGFVFQALYIVAFCSFLRLSNLVPHSVSSFNHLEQLARADILFAHPGVHLIVKWSKTMQNRNKVAILKLPKIENSILCPVAAIKKLLQATPGSKNSPLFQIKINEKWSPLTDSMARKHLKKILHRLHLENANITFHTFRRSGASLAFNANVSIQDIKSHGTWDSDCVWRYIVKDKDGSTNLANTFQKLLSY